MMIFKPLQSNHFPLLLKWLEAPHVKAWWDQNIEWTPELIEEKYGTYTEGYKVENGVRKPIHAYIVCVDNTDIGYIQFYNAHDFSRETSIALETLPNSLVALDIFIGDELFVGKGMGSVIMEKFLKEYIDPYYDVVFVDPDTANIQAIKAYKKAGFKEIQKTQGGAVTGMLRFK